MKKVIHQPNWKEFTDVSKERKQAIVEASIEYLNKYPEYGFTNTELSARIDVPASPAVVMEQLFKQDAVAHGRTEDGKLYFFLVKEE